jgi:transposase-like protein
LAGSGLTLEEFARREGIHPVRIGRWRRKLGRMGRSQFVEITPRVKPTTELATTVAIEIVLSSGRVVRVPPSFDEPTLARLIALLEKPC